MTIIKSQQGEELLKLLFQKINKDLDEGSNVILVVPAQTSLLAERAAFDISGKQGFFKLRIVRGQKLHEEIMHECGYPGLVAINSIGRSMLLRKIAADKKDEFKAFSGVYSDTGFIDMAGDFIVQLKQNNVSDEELDTLIDASAEGSLIKNKLLDMRLMLAGYRETLAGKFTDSEDLLDYVTSRVKDSSLIKDSKIYYYGFYSFTKREYAYLAELARCSKGLGIALLSGSGAGFEISRKTEARLLELVPDAEIVSSALSGPLVLKAEDNMHVVRCANPFSQAQTIASDIRRLIREKAYRYSDIAVLTPDSPQMTAVIERVFSSYDIPFFADEKRSILHTPAAEAVLALLDVAVNNYETGDVIRLLKSGVFDFEREDTELFENYAKQYHIKGNRFLESFRYGKDKNADFTKLETMREIIAEKLSGFTASFGSAESVTDKARCLYSFLDSELRLPEKLDALSETQAEEGFSDAAEETARVWDSICAMLDQFTELMGDEKLSAQEFSDILKTSFADVKVGVLPQSEGKVQLGSIMRSFADGRKAVYIAGFNDGLIPSDNQSNGILTDEELQKTEGMGTVLAKTSDAYSDEEYYMIFKALASADEYLWLGYCVSDTTGSDIKKSTLLAEIQNSYKSVKDEQDISLCMDGLAYLEGKDFASAKMAAEMRDAMGGRELKPVWKEVYNASIEDGSVLREALRFSNKQLPLGKEIARRLFAKEGEYSLSPSRMDGFAACPFRHFVNYGLNPDIPREFGMGGSEVGTVYHEALLQLCEKVDDWKNIDDAELEELIDGILKDISLTKYDGVMLSGKEEIYTSKRIRQVCLRFAKHMAEQIRESNIEKMYLETAFGRNGVFPPVTMETSAGRVYIEGRIDRVDICPEEDGKYVRIVDYKSGVMKFDERLIQKGLSLQLMVYLEGAMGEYTNPAKCGVYYFSIKDPQVAASLQDLPAEEIAEDVLKKINKEYKLDGKDVDEEFITEFSTTLSKLCERLTAGDISVEPKKSFSQYDSCAYCEFSSVCLKDVV